LVRPTTVGSGANCELRAVGAIAKTYVLAAHEDTVEIVESPLQA
jgi:hypothetical protein